MSETTLETPLCECGCGEHVTPGLVFGKPRRYIRGHGPQAKGKSAGRKPSGRTPTLDDLKATAEEPGQDRAPNKAKGKKGGPKIGKPAADEVPYRAGVIARGMNRLYARTGKIVKVMDADIGTAIIESTRKTSDDDVTVGEAWDELAKTNPRIRATLTKMIAGGAWGQVVYAHLPILLAILMKDAISKRIPFGKFIMALAEPDDVPASANGHQAQPPGGLADLLGGLTADDMAQVQGMFGQMVGGMAGRVPNAPRAPEVYPENTEIEERDGEPE